MWQRQFEPDLGRPRAVRNGIGIVVGRTGNRQVQIVFNTTDGQKAVSDSKSLRRATLMQKVPYYTTLSGAAAVAEAIAALRAGSLEVRPLQEYFA